MNNKFFIMCKECSNKSCICSKCKAVLNLCGRFLKYCQFNEIKSFDELESCPFFQKENK